MKVSRGIETAVEEGIEEMVVDRYRYRGGVEEQTIRYKNRSSINQKAIKEVGTFSIDPLGVEKLLRLR